MTYLRPSRSNNLAGSGSSPGSSVRPQRFMRSPGVAPALTGIRFSSEDWIALEGSAVCPTARELPLKASRSSAEQRIRTDTMENLLQNRRKDRPTLQAIRTRPGLSDQVNETRLRTPKKHQPSGKYHHAHRQ